MSDEAPEKSSKTWLYVTAILISVPLCYVLSTGPMVVLAVRGVIPGSAVETVYQPLSWFMRTTGTREPIDSYVMLWFTLTGTPVP